MTRTTKIILAIIAAFVVLCGCAVVVFLIFGAWTARRVTNVVQSSINKSPQNAAQLANEISDFTLPSGYSSDYSLHLSGFTLIGYSSPDQQMHIILMQFPKDTSINQEEMLKRMKEATALQGNAWFNLDMNVTDQKPVTIRGQDSTLVIYKGTNSSGETWYSANVVFEGNGGPAILSISGSQDAWDQSMVEDFISSMR